MRRSRFTETQIVSILKEGRCGGVGEGHPPPPTTGSTRAGEVPAQALDERRADARGRSTVEDATGRERRRRPAKRSRDPSALGLRKADTTGAARTTARRRLRVGR